LTGIESAWGGHRDDRLRGNDKQNQLIAFSGDDVLIGGGGHDFSSRQRRRQGHPGRGRDLLGDSNYATVVGPDCERVWPSDDDASDGGFPSAYSVRRGAAALTYRMACPSVISGLDFGPFANARCRAQLRLTTASKPHRVLARGRSPFGSWKGRRAMTVYLTPTGRRLADRPSGVLGLTTLRLEDTNGSAIASARWAIRLK
jgi:Ca2+-binding RTX toxin-like protein